MRDGGLIQVNAVTLLAGLIVVLMVVLGGFTLSNPPQAVGQAAEPEPDAPYGIVVTDAAVGIEKQDGDPVVYDQLVVYLSGPGVGQRLELAEDHAVGDDGDTLFERDETAVAPLNGSIEPGTSVTAKLVDAGESEIRYRTTVNVTTGEPT
jgi:hypothetical protein